MQDEGTARTLRIAEYLNVPVYIVHVMSGGAMKEIGLAKARGVRVIGEAIASGIAAVEGKIWDPDFKVPPLCRLCDAAHCRPACHAMPRL